MLIVYLRRSFSRKAKTEFLELWPSALSLGEHMPIRSCELRILSHIEQKWKRESAL
nr:hypothetical protein SYMBAF_50345 [Serratia symbiotica]